MKQVHLSIDDSLYCLLDTYLEQTNQTLQDCARKALIQYVSSAMKKKQTELWR